MLVLDIEAQEGLQTWQASIFFIKASFVQNGNDVTAKARRIRFLCFLLVSVFSTTIPKQNQQQNKKGGALLNFVSCRQFDVVQFSLCLCGNPVVVGQTTTEQAAAAST